MCRVGDIILVKEYVHGNQTLKQHSFVVLKTEEGKIESLDYNMICNVMSSFKNPEQREKKLSYPGNMEVYTDDFNITKGHESKPGYIKAEQFYYFDKNNLDYFVLGNVTPELFNRLIAYIHNLDEIEHVTDNLNPEE